MSALRATMLEQTCGGCPSQWEGALDDGRMFYVRYRWGYLSVRVSPAPTHDVFDAVGGEEVLGRNYGDDMGGVMDDATMRELVTPVIDLQSAVTPHGEER